MDRINNQISFKKLYMTKPKEIIKIVGEKGGRQINNQRGKLRKLAEKTGTDIYVTAESYYYDDAANYIMVRVQKPGKNLAEKAKNFWDRINPFSINNNKIFFPKDADFSPKNFMKDIRALISEVNFKK